MGRRTLLTDEVQATIIKYVSAGAYDYIAAEAVGVTATTFWNWMRWGAKGNPRYVAFFEAVTKAKAEARLTAEARVKAENPATWLTKGPGRTRPGRPGWTDSLEVHVSRDDVISEIEAELERMATERPGGDAGRTPPDGE